jgi:hypothetical protein
VGTAANGSTVGMGPLPPNGKTLAMADSLVGAAPPLIADARLLKSTESAT